MTLKKGQIVDVAIGKLAFGGSGIGPCHIPDALVQENPHNATAEGLTTFVPNTIPGDRIKAALTKIYNNRLEAKLVEVMEPSPLRITPRCRHFGTCGGCTWQNLSYPDQLEIKAQQVAESLTHLGGFSELECKNVMKPIIGFEGAWEYRNKMEFSFGMSPEGEVQLGLHLPERRYDVFDLQECFLPSGIFAEIVKDVRDFVHEEKLTVFNNHHQDGLLKNLMVREGKNTGEVMINLITSIHSFPRFDAFRDLFSTGKWAGRIHSLLWTTVMQSPGVPTWIEHQVLAGAEVIHEKLQLENGSSLDFEISADSFFQPNTQQAQVLYAQVIALAELSGREVVYDLYCGTGTIGLFCAHKAQKIYGIDVVRDAIENARANARRNRISNAEFWIGDVGKWTAQGGLPPGLDKPDVVIVDPPRSGLSPDVPTQIHTLDPQKIIYVSCNPSTLARDLKAFRTVGYTVDVVQPVDMFPQTYHIETVVRLTRLTT